MSNKILIIDDSQEILFAISEFFYIKGWESFTAINVEDALKILREEEVDIILIDYHMPHINGTTGTRLIRQINKDTPIIALTIEGKEDIAEEFFAAGADDFAIKPIKVLDLYSRIQVHLNGAKKAKKEVPVQKIEERETKLEKREYPKGINGNTMNHLYSELDEAKEFLSVELISETTGLATKTLNRYLNYLVDENIVELKVVYGKIGRPKNEYRLIRK